MRGRADKARIRDERGFSLIELLIAMALTAVGVAATLGVFGAAGRTTVISQNTEVGAQQAQAELDRLSKLRYGELALTSSPVTPGQPRTPTTASAETSTCAPASPSRRHHSRRRRHRQGRSRPTTSRSARTARRSPASSTATSRGRTRTAHHHLRRRREHEARDRRRESGPGCQHRAAQPAVVLHRDQRPSATPPGYTGTSGGNGSGTGARAPRSSTCTTSPATIEWDGYIAPTGSHDTRNTAQIEPQSASSNSKCNADPRSSRTRWGRQPRPAAQHADLRVLGGSRGRLSRRPRDDAPRGPPAAPRTTRPRRPTRSPTPRVTSSQCIPGPRLEIDEVFHLSGRATVSIWTQTLAGLSGRGFLCASLIERRESSGVPRHHDRLDHLRRLRLAVDSRAG